MVMVRKDNFMLMFEIVIVYQVSLSSRMFSES